MTRRINSALINAVADTIAIAMFSRVYAELEGEAKIHVALAATAVVRVYLPKGL